MLCEYLHTGMVLLQIPRKANQLFKSQIYQWWVDIRVMLNDYETSKCLEACSEHAFSNPIA